MSCEYTLNFETIKSCEHKVSNKKNTRYYCSKYNTVIWTGHEVCGMVCPIDIYWDLQQMRNKQ